MEVKDDVNDNIQVEEDYEGFHTTNIADGANVRVGSSRVSLTFASQDFEARYYDLTMATRTVLFGNLEMMIF